MINLGVRNKENSIPNKSNEAKNWNEKTTIFLSGHFSTIPASQLLSGRQISGLSSVDHLFVDSERWEQRPGYPQLRRLSLCNLRFRRLLNWLTRLKLGDFFNQLMMSVVEGKHTSLDELTTYTLWSETHLNEHVPLLFTILLMTLDIS